MSIKLPYLTDEAIITIDKEKCVGCGACARACNSDMLVLVDGKMTIAEQGALGCVACGHCEVACPKNAISVRGRGLSDGSFLPMPTLASRAGYASLYHLALARQSTRHWKDKEVGDEQIEKILDFVRLAPSGIPPSGVRAKVFRTRAEVRQFSFDFIDFLASQKWLLSKWFG